jgi:hypothetical protein
VGLKLAGAYLLGVGCWVLLLSWLGVLASRQPQPAADALDQQLFRRLGASRRWVAALFGWLVLLVVVGLSLSPLPAGQTWIQMVAALVLVLLAFILIAGTIRSSMTDETNRVRPIWGALLLLLWAVPAFGIALLLSNWRMSIAPWVAGWIVVPAILLPFAASSTVWGFNPPWRRVARLIINWQWWLGVVWAAFVGVGLPTLINVATQNENAPASVWTRGLKDCVQGLLAMGSLVVLLGLLATLLGRRQNPPTEEVLVAVPVLSGPETRSAKAKADLPPSEDEDTPRV